MWLEQQKPESQGRESGRKGILDLFLTSCLLFKRRVLMLKRRPAEFNTCVSLFCEMRDVKVVGRLAVPLLRLVRQGDILGVSSARIYSSAP